MELRLVKSSNHLRRAQEVANSGSWELNLKSGKLFWSDEVYRIFGLPQGSPMSYEDFLESVLPEDRGHLERSWEAALRGEPYDIEHRTHVSGEVKWLREKAEIEFDGTGRAVRGIGTVQDVTDRKQAEQKIMDYQQRLKALASQLTIAEEKERRAIAADLHDHVGQSLALARIQLASARNSISDSKLTEKLDDISDSLLKTLEDTQLLMLGLSSPAMHEIGLSSAISEWLESQIGNRHSLETEVIDNIPHNRRKTLDSDVRTILFRNVRELLVNVVKHARSKKVSVRLEDRNTNIRIIVEDDGIGFEPREVPHTGSKIGGFGLFSIEELMADLGGDLKIVSAPGKGCTAILSAPFIVNDSWGRG
jgi:PAS domain S-box-containing protein